MVNQNDQADSSPIVQVSYDQGADVSARSEHIGFAHLLYGYQRAKEFQENNQPGQDHLAFCYDDQKIAFSVCDGVSQSFYGNLAAKMLGTYLVTLMWELPERELENNEAFADHITSQLNRVRKQANQLVNKHDIPDHLPYIQQQVLRRKQQETGSQTMFVAGRFDADTNGLQVCWLGDSVFHIWNTSGSSVDHSQLTFSDKQRWSSKTGIIGGQVNTLITQLDTSAWLTIYTDGLRQYEGEFDNQLNAASLQQMMAEMFVHPKNDDIAILQIHPLQPVNDRRIVQLEKPTTYLQANTLTWRSVPRADWYRINMKTASSKGVAFATDSLDFDLQTHNDLVKISVQAIADNALASPQTFIDEFSEFGEFENPPEIPDLKTEVALPKPPSRSGTSSKPSVQVDVEPESSPKHSRLPLVRLGGLFLLVFLGFAWQLFAIFNGRQEPVEVTEVVVNSANHLEEILNSTPVQNDEVPNELVADLAPTPLVTNTSMPTHTPHSLVSENTVIIQTPTLVSTVTSTPTPATSPPAAGANAPEIIVVDANLAPTAIDLYIDTPNPNYKYDATFSAAEPIQVCWDPLPVEQLKILRLTVTSPTQNSSIPIPEADFGENCYQNLEALGLGHYEIVLEAVFSNGNPLQSNEVIVRIRY